MPVDGSNFIRCLEQLHEDYQRLSWFWQSFWPRALRTRLESFASSKTNENALEVYRAFFDNTSVFHRSFFTASRVFSHQLTTKTCHCLYLAQLLRGDEALVNFNAVAGHANPRSIDRALSTLHRRGLLSGASAQANFNAVIGHADPHIVAYALSTLHGCGLLTDDSRNAVAGHAEPWRITYALLTLHESGLLTGASAQANFNAVAGRAAPHGIAYALSELHECGLLTDDNRNAVAGHADPCSVATALSTLHECGLLTGTPAQANFNALMGNAAVFCIPDLWYRIPLHALTQERFTRMCQIAERHIANVAQGQAALRAYVNRELPGIGGAINGGAGAAVFNPTQSTHTASVHASASESAGRLKSHYGSRISGHQLDATLESLSAWLVSQPASEKVEAAKRCLDSIRHPFYFHIDAPSGTSTQELLALLWIAIQDEKRTGTLADAQRQMIEALYESQREYRFSDTGVDMGGADGPACAAGTFNKFIEKFHGVHPDVNLLIIARAGATEKFKALVIEEALAYLNRLKVSSSTGFSRLLDEIMAADNGNAVEPLWGAILEAVAEQLFEEFKSLYGNNKNHPDFRGLIESGEYVTLPKAGLTALSSGVRATRTTSPAGIGFFAEDAAAGTGVARGVESPAARGDAGAARRE